MTFHVQWSICEKESLLLLVNVQKFIERIGCRVMAQNDSAKGNTRLGIFSTGIEVYHHVTIKRNSHRI